MTAETKLNPPPGLMHPNCRPTVLESQLLSFISYWIYSSLFRFHPQIDRRAASHCKEKLLIQFFG